MRFESYIFKTHIIFSIMLSIIYYMLLDLAYRMRRSRNFRQGWGGGVQVNLTKIALTTLFLGGSNIFEAGGGINIFQGGGGSNCLFPIETYITCDFSGK